MTPSGVYTPASVGIAVNSTQERDELLSAGKVVLSLSPWDEGDIPAGGTNPSNPPTTTEQMLPSSTPPPVPDTINSDAKQPK